MTSPSQSPSHPKYRPDIDGLRAIAVVSVVIFHAFPNELRGGFIGVDIFFVISGFLISTIIFENLNKGTFSFIDFYGRRIRRIFPALIMLLLCCLAVGWFALLSDEYKQLGKHIEGGAGFVSNFILWREAGYFDTSAETKPLLHLWSLGIEEQFYLLWPLLSWAIIKHKLNPILVTLLLALASFAANLWAVNHDTVAAFYLPQARFWELQWGSLLALSRLSEFWPRTLFGRPVCPMASNPGQRSAEAASSQLSLDILALTGLLLLAYGFWAITSDLRFPGYWAVIPVAGAVLLIGTGPNTRISRYVLANPVLVWLGLVSFPLYLWHWPILSFLRIVDGDSAGVMYRMLAVAASVALALLTYRLVERPIRLGRSANVKTLVLIGAMTAIFGAGNIVSSNNGLQFRQINQVNDTAYDYARHWDGWQKCDFVPHPDTGNGGCEILHPDRPVDVLVIGDSHAGHLASGLLARFTSTDKNVAIILHAGCFPVVPVTFGGSARFQCPEDMIRHAVDYGLATRSIRTIIMSGYPALQIQTRRLHEAQILDDAAMRQNLGALDSALQATFKLLETSGKDIIFIVDNPELLVDPKACAKRLFDHACQIDLPKGIYLQRNAGFLSLIEKYRVLYPAFHFAYASDALCDATTCFGSRDGRLLYATRDHLTPDGSRFLINAIDAIHP